MEQESAEGELEESACEMMGVTVALEVKNLDEGTGRIAIGV